MFAILILENILYRASIICIVPDKLDRKDNQKKKKEREKESERVADGEKILAWKQCEFSSSFVYSHDLRNGGLLT